MNDRLTQAICSQVLFLSIKNIYNYPDTVKSTRFSLAEKGLILRFDCELKIGKLFCPDARINQEDYQLFISQTKEGEGTNHATAVIIAQVRTSIKQVIKTYSCTPAEENRFLKIMTIIEALNSP